MVTWFTKVELLEPLRAGTHAASNFVEILFHLGSEGIVNQVCVVLLHETNNGERDPGWNECRPLRGDIAAVHDQAQNRCIGRGATNAELFQLLHQSCFGVTRRRRGVVALGLNISEDELLAFGHDGQLGFSLSILSVALFVRAFLIRVEEAAECDDSTAGGELHGVSRSRGCLGGHGGSLPLGICHLRSNSALPDQVVELPLVAAQDILQFRRSLEGFTSWANSFVRFLSVLALARVLTRCISDLVCPIQSGGLGACRCNRLPRERRRVSTHVGDVPVFVETLCHAHGLLRGELQLARSFLLQS